MGTVHLFRQIKLDRLVAVKIVRGDQVTPEQIRRLLKEARVLAGLSHPNILAVHDIDTDGSIPYLVSEYVEGESLAQLLRRAPLLPLERVLDLAIPLLDALKTAHEKGVVHRDLKPDNIFLSSNGRPKIGDFGLAKARFVASGISSIGQIVGTPAYLSPEQCRGEGTTPASDLYAMGVVLFEMATGRLPFSGPHLVDFLSQHVRESPPSCRSLRPDLPEAFDAILSRALEKDPAARFAGALEFQQTLLDLYWSSKAAGATAPHLTLVPPLAGHTASGRTDETVAAPAPCEPGLPRPRSMARWSAVIAGIVLATLFLSVQLSFIPNASVAPIASFPQPRAPRRAPGSVRSKRFVPPDRRSRPTAPARPLLTAPISAEDPDEPDEPEATNAPADSASPVPIPAPIPATSRSAGPAGLDPLPDVRAAKAVQPLTLAGEWRWSIRTIITLSASVTFGPGATCHFVSGAIGALKNSGTWYLADPEQRRFLITWKNGFVDTVVLSEEGDRLEGRNNVGTRITATRVKGR